MKKIKFHALLAGLLIVCCLPILSGCGGFDPAAYVEGNLKMNFYNDITDDYIKLCDTTREELEAEWQEFLDKDTKDYIADMEESYGFTADDKTKKLTAEYLNDIFAKAKFEVNSKYETTNKQNYVVTVTMYPLLIDEFYESDLYTKYDEDINKKVESGKYDDLSDDEFYNWYLQDYFKFMSKNLDAIEYGDPVDVELVVSVTEEDGEDLYSITDSSYDTLMSYFWGDL